MITEEVNGVLVPAKVCGNCTGWGEPEEGEFGFCGGIIHDEWCYVDHGKEWTDDEKTLKEIDEMKKEPAVLHDGSGYYAALRCKEDFGCTEWEAKE